MYRVFNFIAVRVMIDEYIRRMNHAARFATQSLSELAAQFTIFTERNQQ